MSSVDEIQFYFFHHHHYNVIPPDEERYVTTQVEYPNGLFDPVKGHELYERHLRTVCLAEDLGFDGIGINEHHNTPYSLTPAVSVMAGAIAARTSRAKILVAGVPINLAYPNRVAEEYAMLDVMSGGRMEYAFPLGTGMEYWSNAAQINPVTARDRFRESLEVILRCWTEDGPLRHDGEFFNYRYLNPWPKPFQKPHPKVFIVGSGSLETTQLAIDFGIGYSITFTPIARQLAAFTRLRELAAEQDRVIQPDEIMILMHAYVADSDEEALREVQPFVGRFWSWFHRVTPKYLLPPGYVSRDEYLRRASDRALAHSHEATWDDMVSIGRYACGAPDTVADMIVAWAQEAGCGRMNVVFEHADMPEWMVRKSTTLFAEEVMPRVRARLAGSASPDAVLAEAT